VVEAEGEGDAEVGAVDEGDAEVGAVDEGAALELEEVEAGALAVRVTPTARQSC